MELCRSTIQLNCRATDRWVTRRLGVEMCPILIFSNDPVSVIGKSQHLTNRTRLHIWPLFSAIVVPDTIGSDLNTRFFKTLHLASEEAYLQISKTHFIRDQQRVLVDVIQGSEGDAVDRVLILSIGAVRDSVTQGRLLYTFPWMGM